ncbi:MAG: chemotaxis protein CheW [Bacillota bacterium]
MNVVIFGLGDELFGLDIFELQEIIRMVEITRVPKAPSFVEGVVNLRGMVIPIIDLKKKLGIEGSSPCEERKILIVNIGGQVAGFIVDYVTEVATVNEEDLEPPPPALALTDRFIQSLVKMKARIVILLKAAEILGAEEKEQLKNITKEDAHDETETPENI